MNPRLRSRLQSLDLGVVSAHSWPASRHRRGRIALVGITQAADSSIHSPDNAPPEG